MIHSFSFLKKIGKQREEKIKQMNVKIVFVLCSVFFNDNVLCFFFQNIISH